MAGRAVSLLLGKCMPSVKNNATKVCVTHMELDPNLLMYFRKVSYVYAYDPERRCKSGDIVLIEELPKKMTKLITHQVNDVVFPLGDIVDPISGKVISGTRFREDILEESELYGKGSNTFDYSKAPPRGWQEGKKDFSDKETYYKYQEIEGQDQPYSH